jgi:hypothetical protein
MKIVYEDVYIDPGKNGSLSETRFLKTQLETLTFERGMTGVET